MDIKGFKTKDGVIHRYDYDSLANTPEETVDITEQVERAETAATAAETAATSATSAKNAAINAQSSAWSAASSAQAAISSAQTAASSAQAHAGSASGSAGFANTRANEADAAATRAEDAATRAEEAVASIPESGGGTVKSVNGVEPDENGNVEITIPDSGGNADLSAKLKTALVNYYTHVMPNFDDANGLTYINAILTALGAETREEPEEPDEPVVPDEPDTPEVTLSSITATYSGGDVTVGTAVTALTGIVVTAHYSDGTSEIVTGYTLSGTIAEGSNTVTVSYGGKTTTFTVTGVVEEGGGETEGTTVAMTKQFSNGNITMKWYSDGGSTPATDCPGKDYLGILVSDNVFTEDTEVKITIVGSARLFDCWNVGCFDFTSDGSFDTNDSVYYAVHFGTNEWANSGVTHEINYTVKAGYNLIITAYGSFNDITSVTVEVV